MKKNGQGPSRGWKFILERLPVSIEHQAIASRLVKAILKKVMRPDSFKQRRKLIRNIEVATAKRISEEEEDERLLDLKYETSKSEVKETTVTAGNEYDYSELRNNLLESLLAPPIIDREPDPDRILTKEELKLVIFKINIDKAHKESLRMQEINDLQASSQSIGDLGTSGILNQVSEASFGYLGNSNRNGLRTQSMSPLPSRSQLGGISGIISSPKSRIVLKAPTATQDAVVGAAGIARGVDRISCITGQPLRDALWLVPDELGDVVGGGGGRSGEKMAGAFSDSSLLRSSTVIKITDEPLKILRQIASESEKRSVYDRCQSQLLLRSPARSVSVKIPPLSEVQKSEVTFGEQKSMYKNANKLLLLKEKGSKTIMRYVKKRFSSSYSNVGH